METVNALLANPQYRPFLSLLKGIRNGLVYGAKIRFPHALVMTFLFHSGSIQDKFRFILRATLQHARNLALMSFIYKSGSLVIEKVWGQKTPLSTFIPGAIAGYIVFGRNDKINLQILLYFLSRIFLGLIRLGIKKGVIKTPNFDVFPFFAALMWGTALTLFEHERDTLQQSLQNSMQYVFQDSSVWHNVWDFAVYNNLQLW